MLWLLQNPFPGQITYIGWAYFTESTFFKSVSASGESVPTPHGSILHPSRASQVPYTVNILASAQLDSQFFAIRIATSNRRTQIARNHWECCTQTLQIAVKIFKSQTHRGDPYQNVQIALCWFKSRPNRKHGIKQSAAVSDECIVFCKCLRHI